jgi:hypothetical protein
MNVISGSVVAHAKKSTDDADVPCIRLLSEENTDDMDKSGAGEDGARLVLLKILGLIQGTVFFWRAAAAWLVTPAVILISRLPSSSKPQYIHVHTHVLTHTTY